MRQVVNDKINIQLQYPFNEFYEYITKLERINLDEQREADIKAGRAFIITASKGIKNDIKNQDGIFSNHYGSNSITDDDAWSGRYRCKCGLRRGSVNNGEFCSNCNTMVRYMDDDVSITGYLVLKDYQWIIHPNLYFTLESFIGSSRLNNIIDPKIEVDSNGNEITIIPVKKNEPFEHIGLLEFKRRFDEIMDFYLSKYPQKKAYYDDIMAQRKNVWTHTIAVYSSLLRPSSLDNGSLRYEDCNDEFKMLEALVYRCRNDTIKIDRKPKEQLQYLYDIQATQKDLYVKIREILARKKGDIRSSIGGRYCFSSRSIIRQDTHLKPDEVRLPFNGLLELMQQLIINILVRSYNFSYAEAYKKWYRAQVTGSDQVIYDIMDGMIKDMNGLPVLINRNPTIGYGGILACKVMGINMDYTMSISLLVLPKLNADFDGDTLNILYLYNQDFIRLAFRIISPRQMFISRNDGRCDRDLIHSRDTLINANGLKSLHKYNNTQISKIKRLQLMDDEPDMMAKLDVVSKPEKSTIEFDRSKYTKYEPDKQ